MKLDRRTKAEQPAEASQKAPIGSLSKRGQAAQPQALHREPPARPDAVFSRIPDITARYGLSRSEQYRLLSAGKIRAVKCGRSILIDVDSVRAHVANLPAATFRQPKAA